MQSLIHEPLDIVVFFAPVVLDVVKGSVGDECQPGLFSSFFFRELSCHRPIHPGSSVVVRCLDPPASPVLYFWAHHTVLQGGFGPVAAVPFTVMVFARAATESSGSGPSVHDRTESGCVHSWWDCFAEFLKVA